MTLFKGNTLLWSDWITMTANSEPTTPEFAAATHRGPRAHNEDSVLQFSLAVQGQPNLYGSIVADGMGGGPAGELASLIALQRFQTTVCGCLAECTYHGMEPHWPALLQWAVYEAHRQVSEVAAVREHLKGMGTTLAVVLLIGETAYFGGVGDSRAYLVRNGVLGRITRDDSLVEELVDAGLISEAEALEHPQSNVITRVLGSSGAFSCPDVQQIRVQPGDLLVLCSDGLWKLGDTQLHHSLAQTSLLLARGSLRQAADAVVCHAVNAGTDDNTTVALLRVP